MLSSMQQPKFKSREVSSFRDFPEGFDLIPKPNPDDVKDIFYSHSGGNRIEMCSSKGKRKNLIVRSNKMDCPKRKPEMSECEKGVIVVGASIDASSPRGVVRCVVDEDDGDIFNKQSEIPGGSNVEMCSSKGKRRNLLGAVVRSNEMDCAQGKQEPSESEKRVIVIGLMVESMAESMCSSKEKKKKSRDCLQGKQASESMAESMCSSKKKKKKKKMMMMMKNRLQAIVESNTMDCPQEKQASESEERVSVIGLMAASAQVNSMVLPRENLENLEDEFAKSYPFWS